MWGITETEKIKFQAWATIQIVTLFHEILNIEATEEKWVSRIRWLIYFWIWGHPSVGVLRAIDYSGLAFRKRFGPKKWKTFTQLSRCFLLMIIYFKIGIRESQYLDSQMNFFSSCMSCVIQSLWTSLLNTASKSDFQLTSVDSLPYLLFNLCISEPEYIWKFFKVIKKKKTWFLIFKFLNVTHFK